MMKRLQSLPTSALLAYCVAATACCAFLLTKVAADSQTIKNQAEGIQLQIKNMAALQAQMQLEAGGGIDYNAEMQKIEKMKNDRYKNDYKLCTEEDKRRNSPNSLC
jgi:hypothetical protein